MLVCYCVEPRGSGALRNGHTRMADGILPCETACCGWASVREKQAEGRPTWALWAWDSVGSRLVAWMHVGMGLAWVCREWLLC